MTTVGHDTFGTRSTLDVGGKSYAYYSIAKAAAKVGDVSRLPFSMKVLLENLLRFEDGGFTVSTADIQAVADWQKNPTVSDTEIQYRPARVLLQDFTGVPCVVDLAAMRDAIAKLGGACDAVGSGAKTGGAAGETSGAAHGAAAVTAVSVGVTGAAVAAFAGGAVMVISPRGW